MITRMCSISGIYLKPGQTVTETQLQQLSQSLAHRGPDGHGYYAKNNVGLFHYRLAINDLSSTGIQPFISHKNTASVANGEIYNADAIKLSLSKHNPDIAWQSHSDCEVIPYLYESSGIKFTEQLRGMYCIALFDARTQQLVLSRDPFGMKQLYYCQTPQGFFFASEPRALSHYLQMTKPNINTLNTVTELHFSLNEETGFQAIQRLLPGETLIIEDGLITSRHQTDPTKTPKDKKTLPLEKNIQLFDKVFEETISKHLMSDVPIGLFLSGGLDSTSILAMTSRLHKKPIQTFTIGFKSKETHNECQTARQLAEKYGTEHTEIEFTEDDFWHYLPLAIQATDDPTADYAIVPTFKLAEAAKRKTPVILSGEGGDELFAGYGRYRHFIAPLWRRKNMYRNGALSSLHITDNTTWKQALQSLIYKLKPYTNSRLELAQLIDQTTWLPNDLLIKLDRTLMWHSLEGRTPFLDMEMMRFSLNCPDHHKLHNKLGKWILRCWLNKHVSDYDPFTKKKGFSVPIRDWLDRRRQNLAHYLLSHEFINQTYCMKTIKKILSTPLSKKEAMAVWGLLYIAGWYDTHILKQPLTM